MTEADKHQAIDAFAHKNFYGDYLAQYKKAITIDDKLDMIMIAAAFCGNDKLGDWVDRARAIL